MEEITTKVVNYFKELNEIYLVNSNLNTTSNPHSTPNSNLNINSNGNEPIMNSVNAVKFNENNFRQPFSNLFYPDINVFYPPHSQSNYYSIPFSTYPNPMMACYWPSPPNLSSNDSILPVRNNIPVPSVCYPFIVDPGSGMHMWSVWNECVNRFKLTNPNPHLQTPQSNSSFSNPLMIGHQVQTSVGASSGPVKPPLFNMNLSSPYSNLPTHPSGPDVQQHKFNGQVIVEDMINRTHSL